MVTVKTNLRLLVDYLLVPRFDMGLKILLKLAKTLFLGCQIFLVRIHIFYIIVWADTVVIAVNVNHGIDISIWSKQDFQDTFLQMQDTKSRELKKSAINKFKCIIPAFQIHYLSNKLVKQEYFVSICFVCSLPRIIPNNFEKLQEINLLKRSPPSSRLFLHHLFVAFAPLI